MDWNQFVDTVQKIAGGTSIILNSFLTYLIIKKSPKQLGSYKYLMIYISWFEIVYSILDIVISPIMFSYESLFVVIIYAKNSIFPRWFLLVLNGVYCGFFGASMGMFALHFIYRYFVATGSKHLKSFNNNTIVYWMMIPVIYGISWSFIAYFICGPTQNINEKLRNKLFSTFSWEIYDIVYIGSYFYQVQPDGSYFFDTSAILGTTVVWIILVSSLIIMVYFGVKCYTKLKYMMGCKAPNTSHNFKNLQSQLFYALVTQTSIPVILMHFPVSVVYCCSFFDKDLGTLSGITSITISLFPALDPLPTMFIVKQYRTTILGFFKRNNVQRDASSQLTPIARLDVNEISSIL